MANEFRRIWETPLYLMFESTNKIRSGKTNRDFVVTHRAEDDIFKKIMQVVSYEYRVSLRPRAIAGNHRHSKDEKGNAMKGEIFSCTKGTIEISLEDPETKERAQIILSDKFGKPNQFVYIKPDIAHAVRNKKSWFVWLINRFFISFGLSDVWVFSDIDDHNPDHDIEYKVI